MKAILIKSFALIMVLSMALSFSTFANAAQVENVEPRFSNAASILCSLGESNGRGLAEAKVIGMTGVSKITVDIYLYLQTGSLWTYLTEYHNTANAMILNDSFDFSIFNGGYYKANFTIVVTRNGVDEIINQTKYFKNSISN